MLKKTVFAFLLIVLACCASSTSRQDCPRPEWGPGDPAQAEEIVMWSAFRWASVADSESAVAPCGGGLSCREVASYAEKLGGKVHSIDNCAVRWTPGGREGR